MIKFKLKIKKVQQQMKDVRLLKFTAVSIIIFFLFAFYGCTGTEKERSTEEVIREIEKLDKTPLKGVKAAVRSRNRGDDRIIVTDFYIPSKGGMLLKIKEDCTVFGSSSINWKGAKLNSNTTGAISKCFCEIGLYAIAVDSFGNTYFSISQTDKYEFVLVENKNHLDNKFSYVQKKGNCYRIK